MSLSKSLEKGKATFSYSGDVSPSGGLSQDLVRAQVVAANITRTLSRNVEATITGNYADNHSIASNRVEISSWSASAGLTYQARPWLSMGLRYRHFDQNSHGLIGNDVLRNQYLFNLTAALP